MKQGRMREMNAYEPQEMQVSGIEIIGYRQRDGKIKIGDGENSELMDDFPASIKTPYGTFVLEKTTSNDPEGKLADGHPGKMIEWGHYA